jgi:hypothetical protein
MWQSPAPQHVEQTSLVGEDELSLPPLDHDGGSYPSNTSWSSSDEECGDAADDLELMEEQIQEDMVVEQCNILELRIKTGKI